MPQVSYDFSSLIDLDPVLTEIFYQHYEQVPAVRNAIFNVLRSDKAKETDLRIGGFQDPVKFEGTMVYDQVDRGYEVTYTHEEFVRGFLVERRLLDDMQYNGIFEAASEMGTAFARKQEKDAASVFNNAFTAGTTAGYDAVALCSDSHPRSRTDATAVDNNLALTLTDDNLETAITTLEGLGDDLGEEITLQATHLIVPRALRKTALQIVGSELEADIANNNVNVHGGLQVITWPFLTDTNAWFVIDQMAARKYLKWFDRVLPEFGAEESFDTYQRKFRGYMRYSYGWSDFRWIVGSNPS